MTHLSFIAVDQHRVICAIQNNPQSLGHVTGRDFDTTFVGRDRNYEVLDPIGLHEIAIRWRYLLVDESSESVSK